MLFPVEMSAVSGLNEPALLMQRSAKSFTLLMFLTQIQLGEDVPDGCSFTIGARKFRPFKVFQGLFFLFFTTSQFALRQDAPRNDYSMFL